MAKTCDAPSSERRWMVSGTPLYTSIDDLNGETVLIKTTTVLITTALVTTALFITAALIATALAGGENVQRAE